MRYECTSETLYINYRTGETLEYRHSNLRLLTARANNGNSDAKKHMALIEPDNDKWKPKPCHPHHAANTAAQTQLNVKTKDTVMNMQTNDPAGTGVSISLAIATSAVTGTLGANFARRYYIVMVIFAYLVSAQTDTCQPLTSIT